MRRLYPGSLRTILRLLGVVCSGLLSHLFLIALQHAQPFSFLHLHVVSFRQHGQVTPASGHYRNLVINNTVSTDGCNMENGE